MKTGLSFFRQIWTHHVCLVESSQTIFAPSPRSRTDSAVLLRFPRRCRSQPVAKVGIRTFVAKVILSVAMATHIWRTEEERALGTRTHTLQDYVTSLSPWARLIQTWRPFNRQHKQCRGHHSFFSNSANKSTWRGLTQHYSCRFFLWFISFPFTKKTNNLFPNLIETSLSTVMLLSLEHLWPIHQQISMATIVCDAAEGFVSFPSPVQHKKTRSRDEDKSTGHHFSALCLLEIQYGNSFGSQTPVHES